MCKVNRLEKELVAVRGLTVCFNKPCRWVLMNLGRATTMPIGPWSTSVPGFPCSGRNERRGEGEGLMVHPSYCAQSLAH